MHESDDAPAAVHGHEVPGVEGRPRVAFIGAGRAGTTLGVAFARAGWQVTAVASRAEERRQRFTALVAGARAFAEPHAVLDEAELIFVTVPDDAIAGVAAELHLYSGQALVHTSGALPASVLSPALAAGTNVGSFHPLVAFADVDQAIHDLRAATVALEGDEALLPVLADLAVSIGARPVRLPAGGKPAYHAAAMLAAGGLVGLLDAIVQVGAVAGLDQKTSLAVYGPLARQALANAERLGVDEALTGPFVRGDVGTIRGHLDVLAKQAPDALALYLAVARRELDIARRRGLLDEVHAGRIEALLGAPADTARR